MDNENVGVVSSFGVRTNTLMKVPEMIKTLRPLYDRRRDVVAPRNTLAALPIKHKGTEVLGFEVKGSDGVFLPTKVALSQIAEKSKIPLPFLRTNAVKYPELAADMVNRWWQDNDVINRIGTKRVRKNQITAANANQLLRLFEPNGTPGTFRAALSPSYLIVNNLDVLAIMLDELKGYGKDIDVIGSATDEKMYIRIKFTDRNLMMKYKAPGHKMIEVPIGASLLAQNSDVGIGKLAMTPELDILWCSNLARSTKSLSVIHVGKEMEAQDFLSQETILKMTEALFSKLRDVLRVCFKDEEYENLAARFAKNAGMPVKEPAGIIENITDKFGLPEESRNSILDGFMEEVETAGKSRFALSQAITRQAHGIRDENFERSLLYEEIGSQVLLMPEKRFREEFIPSDE